MQLENLGEVQRVQGVAHELTQDLLFAGGSVHSALTHLAKNDVQLPLLMAKSRHRSLRALQRYARPGPDAVAALTAAHDPGRPC
jgi:hypothetical protein